MIRDLIAAIIIAIAIDVAWNAAGMRDPLPERPPAEGAKFDWPAQPGAAGSVIVLGGGGGVPPSRSSTWTWTSTTGTGTGATTVCSGPGCVMTYSSGANGTAIRATTDAARDR